MKDRLHEYWFLIQIITLICILSIYNATIGQVIKQIKKLLN